MPTVASAAGSTVQLLAWPSPDYLARQKVGDSVSTLAITPTTNLAALPAMYHGVGGKVRVEQDVIGTTVKSFTPTGFETSAPSLAATGYRTPASATDPAACRPGACVTCGSYSLHTTYTNRSEIFDNLYAWYGATAHVTETTDSSHTMGIGFAVTGGDWTPESTTLTLSTNIGGGSDIAYDGHDQLSNTVNYGHYTGSAPTTATGSSTTSTRSRLCSSTRCRSRS